ncbi:MAG: hypothetical protein V1895_03980 [Parcubacteria group bacterium]
MPRYLWFITALVILIGGIAIARAYFVVDSQTYRQVERSESCYLNMAQPHIAPNGRRPQDGSAELNDATFGTVFPYFAAPHNSE